MKFFTTATALISVIPGIWSLTINTPSSVTQCQPQLLSWSDGQGPYYLTIIPGGQPTAEPLKSFPTQTGTSITWVVDIQAGTKVTFTIKDSTGATSYTDIVLIHPSSDSSCLNGSNNPSSNNPPPQQAAYASAADPASSSATAPSSIASVAASSASTKASLVAAGTAANRPAGTSTPAVQTNNQQVSASSRPTGTTPASPGTTSTGANTSGAQSRFTVGASLVLAGALGLFGAMFL